MSTQGTTLVQTGQVINVRDVTVRGGRPSGLGAFAGAILGGVAGSRIGAGHGSTAASIGGALAGGMVGQRVEESAASDSKTEVTVRLDSGEIQTLSVEPGAIFRIGDTVKVTTSGGVMTVTH
ncbi:MAG TPA: glycine zipper 2TM domain-containing protein [Noviherbaspirillum sp.]|nr:glycine zipper 2TM domain-containing protein [Noviherbaspirillum sp.]